ncbi:methyltransferase domain-containing protein [Geitlerinema sp. CS-897]|uniref:methyltransferase domain-containing protein n=1 Tax=Baaleninema simplex TaxID=2862350 RepID=UPI0003496DB2|nr:methyltransferase domain-containing protein [Baaleninema simplex]MDC0835380.1 methyltransferase domain-containing protein [Geitlerinema sp. CS-897]
MTSTLNRQIQTFYDSSTELWEQVWGEHLHHGYYGDRADRDRQQAQIDLLERLLQWVEACGNATPLSPNTQVLDVGCGVGGSSLYLSRKYGTKATGITLSPVQVQRATERAAEAGRSSSLGFLVADALNVPFTDNSFDWVWSLESGEHMPDKTQFIEECYRLLKPGGTFVLATWCHRPISEPDGRLTASEIQHLSEIYQIYHLPYVISLPEYAEIADRVGFQNLQTEDWSRAVAPFWNDVLNSAFDPAVVLGILRSGWETLRGALAIGLMRDGYQRGLIRYGVLCATKPVA